MVSDRESDFYELFVQRPRNVELVVRACQNRRIEGAEEASDLLFNFIDTRCEQGRFVMTIHAAPDTRALEAELAVRFARQAVRRPDHGDDPALTETVTVTLVDDGELSEPEDAGAPVNCGCLTTRA